MNTPETERPKRIVWDPRLPEDIEEAHSTIESLKSQGFKLRGSIAENSKGVAVLDPPKFDSENYGFMRVLDESGDSRVVWDRRETSQVKEAGRKFYEMLKKGYKAYVARSDGSRGSRLEDFDALLEEIIMVPETMPS
jgi:hypothetical protein